MIKTLRKHYYERYHGTYQHAKKLFAFDLALFLSAIVLFVSTIFLLTWNPGLTDLIDMSVSVGNERIKSGEEIRLNVDFKNKSKFKLNNISLGLHLPEGFIIDRKKTPENIFSNNSTFPAIKELEAGATGQAEIYGRFWSELNKETKFIANLSYQPENSPGREQKLASFSARIPDSVLISELTITTSTLPNIPLKFIYTIKNSGDREINNIFITNNWNENIMDKKETINITLLPGSTKIINGQLLTPNKPGIFPFTLTPQIPANNHLIPQKPITTNLEVLAPQIISSARLLQSLAYAEPGTIIPLEIKWENKSSFKLQNITLHLTSNLSGAVDWRKTAQENNARAEENGIFFDSGSRTNLNDGNLNSADTFNVKIYLLPKFNLPTIDQAYLEIYPVTKAKITQISDQEFSQEGVHIKIPLATEVDFNNIETRYYTSEGDQLGRGPLPPQVGKTTKYWVFVKIINTTNDINEVIFNTSLPGHVTFTGKQSASIGPSLDYNNTNRAISWRYGSLPANSQTGLYFEVSVTPPASEIGKNIQLTDSLYLSATDSFTGKKFELSHQPLNNVLKTNDAGHNLGSKVK